MLKELELKNNFYIEQLPKPVPIKTKRVPDWNISTDKVRSYSVGGRRDMITSQGGRKVLVFSPVYLHPFNSVRVVLKNKK